MSLSRGVGSPPCGQRAAVCWSGPASTQCVAVEPALCQGPAGSRAWMATTATVCSEAGTRLPVCSWWEGAQLQRKPSMAWPDDHWKPTHCLADVTRPRSEPADGHRCCVRPIVHCHFIYRTERACHCPADRFEFATPSHERRAHSRVDKQHQRYHQLHQILAPLRKALGRRPHGRRRRRRCAAAAAHPRSRARPAPLAASTARKSPRQPAPPCDGPGAAA